MTSNILAGGCRMPAVPSPPPSNPPPPPSDPPPPPSSRPDNRTGPAALSVATGAVLRPVRGLLALVTPPISRSSCRSSGARCFTPRSSGCRPASSGARSSPAPRLLASITLEHLCGYEPLRAGGERVWGSVSSDPHFRPWLLFLIPAVGALIGGLVTRLAPECRGGGGDASIDAFHHNGGVVRGACCGSSRWPRSRRSAPVAPAVARARRCRSAARSARRSGATSGSARASVAC